MARRLSISAKFVLTHLVIAGIALFIAGAAWPAMAARLAVTQVLRVDAGGHIQVSAALRPRLQFVGISAQDVEIIP